MSNRAQHLYEFGPFRLDTAERLLLREGRPVPLTPKAFETLVVLVERSGRLVEKDELMKAVWSNSYVEESNLTNNVWALRKTLGEGQNGQGYIETVPKRGYRFMAGVRELPNAGAAAELVLEKHTLTRIVTEEEEQPDSEDDVATWPEPSSMPSLAGRSEKHGRAKWKGRAAVGVLCLLVVAGLLVLYRPWLARETGRPETGVTNQPPLRSMAVLPFKTIGATGDDEYLGIGTSDALITRLGNIRQLIVRPTSAVRRYTDVQQDAVAAGREQGVDAVLDGSVRRIGDRIRVTVQLVRVQDKAVLWSGQFDERFTDIFAVQDSISQQVAQGLMVKLSDEERGRFQKRNQENIEAYQAYLKGRYFWNKRTIEGYKKAVQHFNQAIEIDPAYAQAYAGFADAILFLGGDSVAGRMEVFAKARAALSRAIEMDETLAEPHATLGLFAMNVDRDWMLAEKEFKRAIELNPNYATAHHWYGEFLALMGRFDEGLVEIKRAHELDPLSLIISTNVGTVYYLARQYDRAVEQLRKTLEMDPNYSVAHMWLGIAYSAKGQHEEAIAEVNKIKELADDPWLLSCAGHIYGMAGQREEAQKVLKRLTVLSKQTYVLPSSMVIVYIGLGEKDEAFKWFETVFEENDLGVLALKVNPVLDGLRSDPRYANLLQRAGFRP